MLFTRPAFLALALGSFALARADDDYTETSFNTMGPNDTYSLGWGLIISNGVADYGDQSIAAQFTSATRGTIAKLFIPAMFTEGAGMLKISIRTDAADLVGEEIESWTMQVDSTTPRLYALTGVTETMIESDQKYWLELRALPGSVAAWNMSDDFWNTSPWQKRGLVHGEGTADDFTVETLLPGFRLETWPQVQTVPEPATLAAVGLSLVALRRRKRASSGTRSV